MIAYCSYLFYFVCTENNYVWLIHLLAWRDCLELEEPLLLLIYSDATLVGLLQSLYLYPKLAIQHSYDQLL